MKRILSIAVLSILLFLSPNTTILGALNHSPKPTKFTLVVIAQLNDGRGSVGLGDRARWSAARRVDVSHMNLG